jgi:hypothetical protein
MIPLAIVFGVLGAVVLAYGFVRMPPKQIALLMAYLPAALTAILGGLATLFGRGSVGALLLTTSVALFGWARKRQMAKPKSQNQSSIVRTAMIEMELNHDSGEIDGMMLLGVHHGVPFSMMNEHLWEEVYRQTEADAESRALFETYLDRKMAGWRERFGAGMGNGQGQAPGSGTMSEEEAYQILGLEPGAGPELIRQAHRRLMQRVHPDLGGTDFLAARINAAKDILLSAHRNT